MNMLCSILLPTRKRPDRLSKTIESIKKNSVGDDWEILLRIDNDDMDTISFVPLLCQLPYIRIVIGSRKSGYASVSDFYKEVELLAVGKWCWMVNDDMIVEGMGWDERLKEVPLTGFIVQPEMSRLGGSGYPRAEGQSFPIVPRDFWKPHAAPEFAYLDTPIHELAVKTLGWKTWFLPGITMWHQRDVDADIEAHRK